MKIQSLAIFCGSNSGNNPRFAEEAAALGRSLARNGIQIVYGGGSAGLMGIVADAALSEGGHVTGYIPRLLLEWEVDHRGLTELIICEDMHERKRRIYSVSDAAVILPGGFGTLDELFEIITWNQLTIHDKPIRILNTDGFYDYLAAHMERMLTEGFLYPEAWSRIRIITEATEVIQSFL